MANEMTLWWESMAGPRMFIEKIVTHLSNGKNVILLLDGNLPWQSYMRDFLAHQLSSIQIRQAALGPGGQQEIVPQLLRQLSRFKAGQCPQDYKAQISYLKEMQVFQQCVVWLRLEPDCQPLPVIQFLSDFRGKGLAENGCFVLEAPADQRLPRLSGSVAVLDGAKVIRSDDMQLFSSILADGSRELPEYFRNYAARLAACLSGKDGELVPVILQHLSAEEDPLITWSAVEDEYGAYRMPRRSRQELERLVWKAQLQTVFADIELERLRITTQWEQVITEALETRAWDPKKAETVYVRQFGEEVKSAADAELGTLVHMMGLRRSDDHSWRLLSIPDEREQNWIRFLCQCRNKLAHHTVCPHGMMMELLPQLSLQKG